MSHNKFVTSDILVILTILAILPVAPVKSQNVGTVQSSFGQALIAVQRAESAGATSTEISTLVASLNTALEQDREALKLNAPNEAEKRAELLAQVDQILKTVQNQAIDLTIVASQRTFMNTLLTYVSGAIAAVVGTVVFAFIMSFRKRYRIRCTFHMRISLK
jgi:predicted PurR-regulated permease PerM